MADCRHTQPRKQAGERQGRSLKTHQVPAEAWYRGFHKHPTRREGCRAVLPLAPGQLVAKSPEILLTRPVIPSWRPSPAPTHLRLLLEPASRPLLPFQQLLQLGHAACGHALCHLLLQLLHPLGVLGPGQPQALGGSIQLPGKRQSGCGLTAQTCRVTTRHRKLHLYLVGHPTR